MNKLEDLLVTWDLGCVILRCHEGGVSYLGRGTYFAMLSRSKATQQLGISIILFWRQEEDGVLLVRKQKLLRRRNCQSFCSSGVALDMVC